MVTPILLYGCEIWGYEKFEILEQLHLKFLKLASGLKNSTPNFMVYGELVRFPFSILIHKRMISYWYKTITENRTIKFSQMVCNIIRNDVTNKWLKYIQNIFNSSCLSYVFNSPEAITLNKLLKEIETTLKDQYLQKWLRILNRVLKVLIINISNKN